MAWAMQTLSLCICVQDLCRIIGRGLFSFFFRIDFLWPPCAMRKDCRAFSKCWLSSAQSLGQGHQLPTQSLGQGDISPFQLLHPTLLCCQTLSLLKAQRTQEIEYFGSFNNFVSKQKLQQALKSMLHFSLVLFGKRQEHIKQKIHVTTLTNPFGTFDKSP